MSELNDFYSKGLVFLDAEDYEKAIHYFMLDIENKPNKYESYCKLGICYYSLHQYEKAIEELKRALRLNDKNWYEAHLYEGKSHKALGRLDDAISCYNFAISYFNKETYNKNDLAEIYYELGMVYKAKGDNPNAIGNFKIAIQYNEYYKEAYDALITVCSDWEINKYNKKIQKIANVTDNTYKKQKLYRESLIKINESDINQYIKRLKMCAFKIFFKEMRINAPDHLYDKLVTTSLKLGGYEFSEDIIRYADARDPIKSESNFVFSELIEHYSKIATQLCNKLEVVINDFYFDKNLLSEIRNIKSTLIELTTMDFSLWERKYYLEYKKNRDMLLNRYSRDRRKSIFSKLLLGKSITNKYQEELDIQTRRILKEAHYEIIEKRINEFEHWLENIENVVGDDFICNLWSFKDKSLELIENLKSIPNKVGYKCSNELFEYDFVSNLKFGCDNGSIDEKIASSLIGEYIDKRKQYLENLIAQETKNEIRDHVKYYMEFLKNNAKQISELGGISLRQIEEIISKGLSINHKDINLGVGDLDAIANVIIGGGAIGAGILSGGAGLALIASGPIGWIAGAILGGVILFKGKGLIKGMLKKLGIGFNSNKLNEELRKIEQTTKEKISDSLSPVINNIYNVFLDANQDIINKSVEEYEISSKNRKLIE